MMGNCMSICWGKVYRHFEKEEEEDEEVLIYEDYSYDESSSTSSESEFDDDYSSAVSQESYLSDWQWWVASPQWVFLKTTNRPF